MQIISKNGLRYVTAAALLTLGAPVHADISYNFGFGLGAGQTEVNANDFNDGSLGNTATTDDSTFAWSAYGEMKFNRYLRMEFGLIDGGIASMDATSNGSGSYWWGGPVSAEYGLGGLKVGAVATLPFGANDRFKLLAKVGLINWFSVVTLSDYYSDETETDTGLSPYLGVGAELDLTKLISLRLQHEAFSASADSDYFANGYDFDYAGTTLGILFRF